MQHLQKYLLSLNEKHAKAFLLALSLLTRFPVDDLTHIKPQDSGRSALYYPVVGLLIGLILYIPVILLAGLSPILTSAIIVTLWAMITGALHLDGLADSADGWLGGMGNLQKTLTIMKDPRVGTAGVVALVCLLLIKFSAVLVLLKSGLGWLIIFAPVIGRGVILLLFITTKTINNQGMAQQVIDELPRESAWWVVSFSLLMGAMFSLWGLVLILISFWFLRRLMLKVLGGCTGDTAGATVEISEMFWLIGCALLA